MDNKEGRPKAKPSDHDVGSEADVAHIQLHIDRGGFDNWLKMVRDDRLARRIPVWRGENRPALKESSLGSDTSAP